VQSWNLKSIDLPGGSRSPVVLFSRSEARAVLIGLEPGQELGDHQVKENAFLVVLDGGVQVRSEDGTVVEAGGGTLLSFEVNERHTVASAGGARLLLVLAPWPGEGHFRPEEHAEP
jgi:quercetin dioxygenase-like cupin family protein